MAFGGTFCNIGAGFGTLMVHKESQLVNLNLWHCLRVMSFTDSLEISNSPVEDRPAIERLGLCANLMEAIYMCHMESRPRFGS